MPGMTQQPKKVDPAKSRIDDEGYHYWEDNHPKRKFKKGAKNPNIQVARFLDDDQNPRDRFIAVTSYGGCRWTVIRPTYEMARYAAEQFYMATTHQGKKDSELV